MLFFLIVMRMAGFVFLNPVLGRRNIPSQVKVGLSMVMAVLVYSTAVSQGTANEIETGSAVVFGVLAVKELLIGYFLGFVMQLFDMILTFAGTVIDFQLGISMAMVYDAQTVPRWPCLVTSCRFFTCFCSSCQTDILR